VSERLLDQADIAVPKGERRGEVLGTLDGLRVLCLPHNRADYFSSLLRMARKQNGWRIHIPCSPSAEKTWSGIVGPEGGVYTVPDFTVPASWEQDAVAVEELDRFVASCEGSTGISAGRIILAGERDLGRGFSESTYYWPHNRIARRVLADTSEPFRILRRMFAFARDTLRLAQPNLVVAAEWADPLCFCFNLAARQMGIACVVNRLSKLWSGRCYWSTDPLMYSAATRARAAALRVSDTQVSHRAHGHIVAFRAKPNGRIQENEEANCPTESWRSLWPARAPPTVAMDYYLRTFLKWRQANLFRRLDDKTLREMRYVFIALHMDPGRAFSYQAPFWFNQYNTVSILSGTLPAGYRLLVREHPNNAGRRPTRYYRELSRLPGVVLIDSFDNRIKYSANANLIVTDFGSVGWEGLLLGRPVITLADTFYDAAGLAHRLRDPEALGAKIVEILNQTSASDALVYDKALGWMLDAEWDNSAEVGEAGHRAMLDLLADLCVGKGAHARKPNSSIV
jgi:hypothetical protein